ncbi:MAG: hypothetical protein AB9897_01405 [Anaerolineaceae bacterium]
MRWKFWIGLILLLAGLAGVVFLLAFPQKLESNVNITLADGSIVHASTRVIERGWVGDSYEYSLNLATEANPTQTAPFVFKARLNIGNLQTIPTGTITFSLQAGDSAKYLWQSRSYQPGNLPGVLWLSQSNDAGQDFAIYAKEFTFSTNNYFGVSPLIGKVIVGIVGLGGVCLLWLTWREKKHKPF